MAHHEVKCEGCGAMMAVLCERSVEEQTRAGSTREFAKVAFGELISRAYEVDSVDSCYPSHEDIAEEAWKAARAMVDATPEDL